MTFKDPQQIIAIATIASVISMFIVSIIALFGNMFLNWLRRPRIKFSLKNTKPHMIQGHMYNAYPIWYFRLKVKNIGKTVAKNCYMRINSVLPEDGDVEDYFEPDKLKWSGAPRDMRYRNNPSKNIDEVNISNLPPIFKEHKNIPPNDGWEFCDLFEAPGDTTFKFISNGVRPSFGVRNCSYIIEIEIFGDNLKPRKAKFKISKTKDFPLVRVDWA